MAMWRLSFVLNRSERGALEAPGSHAMREGALRLRGTARRR